MYDKKYSGFRLENSKFKKIFKKVKRIFQKPCHSRYVSVPLCNTIFPLSILFYFLYPINIKLIIFNFNYQFPTDPLPVFHLFDLSFIIKRTVRRLVLTTICGRLCLN